METKEEKKSRALASAERKAEEATKKAEQVRKHETLLSKLDLARKLAKSKDYTGALLTCDAARALAKELAAEVVVAVPVKAAE